MIMFRALCVWFVLILAEIAHGIARGVLLVPAVGDFRARQIGVFTGSLIILAIAWALTPWLGAWRRGQFVGVGLLWAGLTLAFEILFGRFVVGASWERLLEDFRLWQGGLMPLGIAVLALAPLLAARVRGLVCDANEELDRP